ncbi:MAG: hypothetical protein ACLFPI_10515 [Desulfobacterales bacterium]
MTTAFKSAHPRAVVHINVADFAAAVEQRTDPRLKKHPLIVAPQTGGRAYVYDMSEQAYQAGVRKGMAVSQAGRMCRDAVITPPSPELYRRAMKAMFRQVCEFSPFVEPGEIDGHFFADLTGTRRLFGAPQDAAKQMYCSIRDCFGLRPVWSVAANKLVSKVATRVVKPLGECVVKQGEEADFLAPLCISMLPGIKTSDITRLNEFNLNRIGRVAALGFEELEAIFGKRAGFIYDSVRGIDSSQVRAAWEKARKISVFCRFSCPLSDADAVERRIYLLAEKIGAQLRSRGRAAGSLFIAVQYADGMCCFRSMTVSPPCWDDITLFEACLTLLKKAWIRRVRLHGIRISCLHPVAPQVQMELFSRNIKIREKRNALVQAVDRVRSRFGSRAVCTGRTLISS